MRSLLAFFLKLHIVFQRIVSMLVCILFLYPAYKPRSSFTVFFPLQHFRFEFWDLGKWCHLELSTALDDHLVLYRTATLFI